MKRADALRQQLVDVYGFKGRDLEQVLYKSRRSLPRALRQAGAQIVQAQALVGHPKLERMIDFQDLSVKHDQISTHLDEIDTADIRRGKLLAMAGRIAFYLIFVMACLIVWAVRSGYL